MRTSTGKLAANLQVVVLAVVVLYFGQSVLLPIVTAILLTFLLWPAVQFLERRSLSRSVSIGIVALGIAFSFGSVGWVVTRQLHDLASHLDEYRGHMREKILSVQQTRFESIENVRALIREAAQALGEPVSSGEGESNDPTLRTPRPGGSFHDGDVKPQSTLPARSSSANSTAQLVRLAWNVLSTPLAMTLATGVLVLFMLASFEELRNRVLRLAGQSHLSLTTHTLDDVSRRISRYLLTAVCVNGGFGCVVWLGLTILGIDHAPLWGFLAAMLRFVPYVGAIAAVGLPLGMSIVQFPGWTQPLLVAGMFLLFELVLNNLVEPWAYGRSAGVSTVALLVAAAFWAWLWGPWGLILSVPMTVVLAVLGRHVPQFEVLAILLGDEPALSAHETFYQRLVAGDTDEADALLEEQLDTTDRVTVYDQLILPAMALTERDRLTGQLDAPDARAVESTIETLSGDHALPVPADAPPASRIIGWPANGIADELMLSLLQHAAPAPLGMIVLHHGLMTSEKLAEVFRGPGEVVLLSSAGAAGLARVRHLCQRIHQELPQARLIVGCWQPPRDLGRFVAECRSRGADQVVTSFGETLEALGRFTSATVSTNGCPREAQPERAAMSEN